MDFVVIKTKANIMEGLLLMVVVSMSPLLHLSPPFAVVLNPISSLCLTSDCFYLFICSLHVQWLVTLDTVIVITFMFYMLSKCVLPNWIVKHRWLAYYYHRPITVTAPVLLQYFKWHFCLLKWNFLFGCVCHLLIVILILLLQINVKSSRLDNNSPM